MSDKVCCQPYEVDYEKVVQEIEEALYTRMTRLKNELKDEHNPIRYIENKAILNDVQHLRNAIFDMVNHCRKPIGQGVQEDDELKGEPEI